MNKCEILKKKLEKIFPKFKINVVQNYGIIKTNIGYYNFYSVIYTDVIGNTDNQILCQIVNEITARIMEYFIDLNEVEKFNINNKRM